MGTIRGGRGGDSWVEDGREADAPLKSTGVEGGTVGALREGSREKEEPRRDI